MLHSTLQYLSNYYSYFAIPDVYHEYQISILLNSVTAEIVVTELKFRMVQESVF